MKHILSHIVFCLLAFFCGNMNLHAQEEVTDTLWLSPFTVQAQRLSEVYPVDSISELVLQESSSLVDALRGSGNHYVREYGVGNIANISMRGGTAQQSALYWNGLPINSPSLGQSDLSLIPAIFLDEVRIHAGASSLLTGTGGLSGSVLLQSGRDSRQGSQLRIHQRISPALGRFATDLAFSCQAGPWYSRTAIHSETAANAYKYIDDAGPVSEEKIREQAATASKGISQDVSYSISKQSSVSLHMYLIDAQREIPSNIGLPRRDEEQDDRIGRLAFMYNRNAGRWSHSLLIGGSEEGQRYRAPYANIESKVQTSASHIQATSVFSLFNNSLIRGRVSHDKFILNLDGQEKRISQLSGFYAEVNHTSTKQLKLNAGARLNHMDGVWRPATISLGLSQRIFRDGMSLKASWSKNHRDPTLNDRFWPVLGNPNLASESGYSSDLALQVEDKKVNWSLGGFYNQFEDLISWLPASDGQFRPINVSKSSSIGIESHIRIDIRNWLEARSSYTYTQSLIRRLEGGQNQANIYQPEHRFSFGFTVKTGQHAIGSTYDYSSTVRTDFLVNAHRLASIHLWDISYRWTPNKARAVSVGVDFNNLLNRNYQYVAQRPTAGRFLQFHLSIKINEKP